MRERVIGKKCEFNLEYNFSGRDYGTLTVDGQNMNLELVRAGLAKVIEKKGNMQASASYEQLIKE